MADYIYKYQPVDNNILQKFVGPNTKIISITELFLEVSCDDKCKPDLDEYLATLGFIPV
jgi:hypothetical protein